MVGETRERRWHLQSIQGIHFASRLSVNICVFSVIFNKLPSWWNVITHQHRKYSISHNEMPSYVDHQKFVNSEPYKYWFLIYEDFEVIGSFYIKEDNSIGLDLQKQELSILKRIIFFKISRKI